MVYTKDIILVTLTVRLEMCLLKLSFGVHTRMLCYDMQDHICLVQIRYTWAVDKNTYNCKPKLSSFI